MALTYKPLIPQQGFGQSPAAPGSPYGVNSPAPAAPSAPSAPSPTSSGSQATVTPAPTTRTSLTDANPQQFSSLSSFSTSYNPASGQPDPRDSNYWSNLAQLLATSQQGYSQLGLEQSSADTAYGQKLTEAGEERRRSVRDLAESLIGTGLLRSGRHNRMQTEKTIDYTNMLAGWGQEKSSEDARRAAQMAAILQNLGIGEFGLYSGAVDRYSQKQLDAAASQSPTVEQPTPTGGPSEADIAKAFQVLANPKSSKKARAWANMVLGGLGG